MSIRKSILVLALSALSISAVHAQGAAAAEAKPAASNVDKTPGSGPNPFTDCGIGAALFKDVHWAALTSNVIWDLGTTAVTSATASPQTCNGKKVETAVFIRDSYEQLAEETAKGEGEHLSTALNMFECPAGQHAAAIVSTREAVGAIVTAPGYAALPRLDKASRFYNAIDTAVAKNCAA